MPETTAPEIDLEAALRHAMAAAYLAWENIAGFYRGAFEIYEKIGEGPATEADILADHTILNYLKEHYPPDQIGYLSEETAHSLDRLQRPYVWIIDPIDGTKDFIEGLEDFAIQIGLAGRVAEGGPYVPLLGVVYQPPKGWVYHAIRGRGAWREEVVSRRRHPLRVSAQTSIADMAMVVTRSSLGFRIKAAIAQLQPRHYYQAGSLGVKVAHVSEGRADAYLNTARRVCKEWDTCAPHAILNEAGGRLTDLLGQEVHYNRPDVYIDAGLLATNPELHPRLLEALKDVAEVWEE